LGKDTDIFAKLLASHILQLQALL
jgi:hypothetical protein